jgi:hypothetical protein
MLVVPTQVTEVHVGLPLEELANAQIKEQEKQRMLGAIPNFYVSYVSDDAPLKAKHKFARLSESASWPGLTRLEIVGELMDRGRRGYGKHLSGTGIR